MDTVAIRQSDEILDSYLKKMERSYILSQGLDAVEGHFSKSEVVSMDDENYTVTIVYGIDRPSDYSEQKQILMINRKTHSVVWN